MTPATPNPWLHRRPLCIAHQGGELEAPSSTLYAMKRAVDLGVDALELDVHATADGQVVVLHDPTVDRTTDGSGAVADLSLAQLQQLDAAHWFVPGIGITHDRAAGEYPLRGIARGTTPPPAGFAMEDFTIPSLAEVFDAFPAVLINLDIKATAPATVPYETAVADLVASYGRTDSTMIASFSDAALTSYRACAPAGWTSAGPAEVLAFYTAVNNGTAGGPAPPYAALQVPATHGELVVVTEPFVVAAHRAGVAVHVWTIDDEATMRALLDVGADGVVTNRPTLLLGVLAN